MTASPAHTKHPHRSGIWALYTASAVVFASLALAPPAQAARRVALLGGADVLYPVAPLPSEFGGSGVTLGYKCNRLSLLGASIWNSHCRLVAMPDESTYALLPAELANHLEQDPRFQFAKAQRGLWDRYGFWGPVSALGLLVAALVLSALLSALLAAVNAVFQGKRKQAQAVGEPQASARSPAARAAEGEAPAATPHADAVDFRS